MKAATHQTLPRGVGASLDYRCADPTPSGVCFRLRLSFRDETRQPPIAGKFDHEWVVSRQDLDEAELVDRSDLVLLGRRAQEEREFLRGVEATLRKEGFCIERIGRELVMRRAEI